MQLRKCQFWWVTVFALLAPAIGAGQGAHAPDASVLPVSAGPSIGQKITLAGVPNFGEVTPTLYRGAQPNRQGFEGLAKMGIGIVVDFRGSRTEQEAVTKFGMQYVSIPWECSRPQDQLFARFLTLIRENPSKKVFVHCRIGEDRTGMMIASYRMAEQGWTAAQARQEMETFGFSRLHHLMCPGLASYEKDFPRRLQSNPVLQSLRPTPSATQP
jgi:tyrosine-protein phosphatase SIW14